MSPAFLRNPELSRPRPLNVGSSSGPKTPRQTDAYSPLQFPKEVTYKLHQASINRGRSDFAQTSDQEKILTAVTIGRPCSRTTHSTQ